MNSFATEWLKLADSDYDSAVYLFNGARYPQALYMLGQALEKLIKTALASIIQQEPPKTHDLISLLEKSQVSVTDDHMVTVRQFNIIYKTIRYSDIAQARYNTRRKTEPIFIAGTQLYLWIKQQL